MGVFLGEVSPRTSLFPAWSPPGGADSSNRRVTHGFTGENRAAFTPPPRNVTISGTTWCLGERIHVRN